MKTYSDTSRFPSLAVAVRRGRGIIRSPFNRTADTDPAGRIRIVPRQIYILPSRTGLIFTIMLVTMLIGSNNYGINLGFSLTFLLAGIGLASMLQTWRNLVDLNVLPRTPDPVFAGESVKFCVTLDNRRPTDRAGLRVGTGDNVKCCDLPAHRALELSFLLPAAQRGLMEPGRFTLATCYPTELFQAWAYFHTSQKCLVFPRPASPDRPLAHLFRKEFLEQLADTDQGDFAGHRKFRPGDAMSRVDWKALARGKEQLVKHFNQPEAQGTWLKWEDVLSRDTEEILSILCRAIVEFSRLELHFGLSIPGLQIEPSSGAEHRTRCLTALAEYPR